MATTRSSRGPALAIAVVVGLIASLLSLRVGLNGEVQFVLGSLSSHEAAGATFVDTFASRPIAYRLIFSGIGDVLGPLTGAASGHAIFEAALRLLAIAACGGAAFVLRRALEPRLGRAESIAVALAAAFALAFPPAWDFLQPEWVASLVVVLAIPAALLPRRASVAGAVSGLLVALAVAVKLGTLPLAPLAILLIWLLDRRRAVAATVGAAAWGLAWLGLVLFVVPFERDWMLDLSRLNPNSPLRARLNVRDAIDALESLGNQVALVPIIAGAPAAILTLARIAPRWRDRAGIVLAGGAALALACGPLVLQAEWILYHLTPVAPLAAGLVALAAVRWWRATGRISWVLVVAPALLAIGTTVLLSVPAIADRHPIPAMAAIAAVALGLGLVAAFAPEALTGWRPRQATTAVVVGVAALLGLAPVLAPNAAWSLDGRSTPWHTDQWANRSAAVDGQLIALSREIGRATPVLYLTWGDVPYHLGNPTDCRYPSPVWLQRGIFPRNAFLLDLGSYADNLSCLSSPVPRYLVLDPSWFPLAQAQPQIRQLVEATYDCTAAISMASLEACPRRP
ncbi:MAG: hypothetical protein HY263_05615 [Chloroflexi bacterium]|nr:hypothetical protein [Chloroflexota bacterium]